MRWPVDAVGGGRFALVWVGTAAVVVIAAAVPSAAPAEKKLRRPRIVAARMLDANRDGRADRVRLTYSVKIQHRLDRDGHYPFRVAGYRIRRVAAAKGKAKTLVILLVEKRKPDGRAHPLIRYTPTRSKPVTAAHRGQAVKQAFQRTRPDGDTPQTSATTTTMRRPRIVAARMLDANRDGRADRVRLTYSLKIRHKLDRDGHYPFRVVGYRIRRVAAANGKTKGLVILLVEKKRPDGRAHPLIRYTPTRSKPVTAAHRGQAIKQLFRHTRPDGETPATSPRPTTTTTTATITTTTTTTTTTAAATTTATTAPTTTVADSDRDGTPDTQDCAPHDPSIHPGAPDLPDLAFVDSNCDGIDGTVGDAIFVSAAGDDANPGTQTKPKRTIQAAVTAAAGTGRYVLVATGNYNAFDAAAGVSVYGGYDPHTWSRHTGTPVTAVSGSPQGVLADHATGVTLQLLTVQGVTGSATSSSAYGIRAINGSRLTLEHVTVAAGPGVSGGRQGLLATAPGGRPGQSGAEGRCDVVTIVRGGIGGASPTFHLGGTGGRGGAGNQSGQIGGAGVNSPGGAGGAPGSQGTDGKKGQDGVPGFDGTPGVGGTATLAHAGDVWIGEGGGNGTSGWPGDGGGGGGGGGGQTGTFVIDGTGGGGGGGGGGGAGGRFGAGGQAGGGSFGVYLYSSTLVADSSTTIRASYGGDGGDGGDAAAGGAGGYGGAGGRSDCNSESTSQVGWGGDGGQGGHGGHGGGGGGGAGGPSIGIFKVHGSTATVNGSTVIAANGGRGGKGGSKGLVSLGGADGEDGQSHDIYP